VLRGPHGYVNIAYGRSEWKRVRFQGIGKDGTPFVQQGLRAGHLDATVRAFVDYGDRTSLRCGAPGKSGKNQNYRDNTYIPVLHGVKVPVLYKFLLSNFGHEPFHSLRHTLHLGESRVRVELGYFLSQREDCPLVGVLRFVDVVRQDA
jgi:hypothetical protein